MGLNPDVIKILIEELEMNCGTHKQQAKAVECLPCLFDIDNDPCEYDNLADKLPQVVLELFDLLNEYNRTAIPPLNGDELVTYDSNANPKYWNCTVNNWTDFPFDGSTDGVIRNCPRPIINVPTNV
jgi:arylsulfatase B